MKPCSILEMAVLCNSAQIQFVYGLSTNLSASNIFRVFSICAAFSNMRSPHINDIESTSFFLYIIMEIIHVISRLYSI